MRRLSLFVILLKMSCSMMVLAQSKMPAYTNIVQLKPTYGFNFPITKLLNGSVPDHLIGYSDNSDYLQIYSVTFFTKKHWGVELNYQAVNTHLPANNAEVFKLKMQNEYGSNYYVSASAGNEYASNIVPFVGQVNKGFIGLVYRYEKGRFYVYPKANLGVTSFSSYWGKVKLKQKNSNQMIEVNYSPNKHPVDMLFLGVSNSIGVKLTPRIYLNFDSMLGATHVNLSYSKKTKILATDEEFTEQISYKNYLINFSMGLGIIVVLY